MGFGPIAPENDEPVFHAEWEKCALGLTLAADAMGHWTIDESRYFIENVHPEEYYSASYYELWIKALEKLLVRHGFVTAEELSQGRALVPGTRPKQAPNASEMAAMLTQEWSYCRPMATPPLFTEGQRVRTRTVPPVGHTRLPRYARGRVGIIETVHGGFVFPDASARGEGEQPQWLYTVLFDGTEIWGVDADPSLEISVDAWESYLEPV